MKMDEITEFRTNTSSTVTTKYQTALHIMAYDERSHFKPLTLLFSNDTIISNISLTFSDEPTYAVIIGFQIGRILSLLCVIFGILGNTLLLAVIYRSAFYNLSYGLLITFIAIFDIIRLIS